MLEIGNTLVLEASLPIPVNLSTVKPVNPRTAPGENYNLLPREPPPIHIGRRILSPSARGLDRPALGPSPVRKSAQSGHPSAGKNLWWRPRSQSFPEALRFFVPAHSYESKRQASARVSAHTRPHGLLVIRTLNVGRLLANCFRNLTFSSSLLSIGDKIVRRSRRPTFHPLNLSTPQRLNFYRPTCSGGRR